MVKISIITACFNSGKTIEATIKSVVNQTYEKIEYIVVDGASSDDTLAIVDRYRHKISRVISEPDKGVYDAFNKGVRAATGDVIYFLNSDDYLYDEKVIEMIAEQFSFHPEMKIIYGNIEVINERNGYSFLAGQPVSEPDLQRGVMPPHPGTFVKKELLVQYGKFDLTYKIASDFDLMMTLFRNHQQESLYIDRTISVFRTGGLSSELKNMRKVQEETDEIVRKHFRQDTGRMTSPADLNLPFYKKWLEDLLLLDRPISHVLAEADIRKVALFGTREMALYVWKDLEKSGVTTETFLDNSVRRQDRAMCGIPIASPEWLASHSGRIDAVILAFEGDYEEDVCAQIDQIVRGRPLKVLSWKDLVCLSEQSV